MSPWKVMTDCEEGDSRHPAAIRITHSIGPQRCILPPLFEVTDVATDRFCLGHIHGPACQHGIQGIGEIVGGWLGTGLAKADVKVVNSAAIDNFSLGVKDSRLGGNLCTSDFHQFMQGIEYPATWVLVLAEMSAYRGRRLLGVHVNQLEIYTTRMIGIYESVHSRGIAIRDGTISAREDQNGSGCHLGRLPQLDVVTLGVK